MKKKETKTKLFMIFYSVALLLISMSVSECSDKKNDRQVKASIPMPEVQYKLSPDSLPFRFEISDQAQFAVRKTKKGEYFCDLSYPNLQAHVYCTWHEIPPGNLQNLAEESHKLAYQHSSVAKAIREKMYSNDSLGVYGILYDLEGDVATPIQLGLTDSISFFFNASLYLNLPAQSDSIVPLLDYIRKDLMRMMETFHPKRSHTNVPL